MAPPPPSRRQPQGKLHGLKNCSQSQEGRKLDQRKAVSGGRNRRPVNFLFSKFMRFFYLREMLLLQGRKSTKEQGQKFNLIDKISLSKELGETRTQTNLEAGGNTASSWRDPDAEFCCICGDEVEEHVEPTCPYNYLSPTSYAPCKARHLFWGNETTAFPWMSQRPPKEVPEPDETTLRCLEFLRRFVRVNNLPEQCCPEQVASLFNRFGPLWSWGLASQNSGASRGGFGYVVFQHRGHAEEAIDALNCYNFGGCKLRVDWAYPCA